MFFCVFVSLILILLVLLINCKRIKNQEMIIKERKIAIHEVIVTLNHYLNNPLSCVLANVQFSAVKLRKIIKESDNEMLAKIINCLALAEQESLKIKSIMELLLTLEDMQTEEYIPGIAMLKISKYLEK